MISGRMCFLSSKGHTEVRRKDCELREGVLVKRIADLGAEVA